jgi:hypothetical protein
MTLEMRKYFELNNKNYYKTELVGGTKATLKEKLAV